MKLISILLLTLSFLISGCSKTPTPPSFEEIQSDGIDYAMSDRVQEITNVDKISVNRFESLKEDDVYWYGFDLNYSITFLRDRMESEPDLYAWYFASLDPEEKQKIEGFGKSLNMISNIANTEKSRKKGKEFFNSFLGSIVAAAAESQIDEYFGSFKKDQIMQKQIRLWYKWIESGDSGYWFCEECEKYKSQSGL